MMICVELNNFDTLNVSSAETGSIKRLATNITFTWVEIKLSLICTSLWTSDDLVENCFL